jgi:quercetin dioxygenase-like cupin family protein
MITSDALHVRLGAELEAIEQGGPTAPGTRHARTIVKTGALRVTLVVLGTGGVIDTHRAEWPVSVHVLRGSVMVRAAGETFLVGTDELLAIRDGVEHDVTAMGDAAFLLTVAMATPAPAA